MICRANILQNTRFRGDSSRVVHKCCTKHVRHLCDIVRTHIFCNTMRMFLSSYMYLRKKYIRMIDFQVLHVLCIGQTSLLEIRQTQCRI